jgi:threonine aldolase
MPESIVELRSDTFTRPTPQMRRAMAEADVGDDVFGEDPTTNALQERCAELFGKEAALFVASGTMGNQVVIKSLTQPGDEVLIDERAHIVTYEMGAPAAISGVMMRGLPSRRGVLDPDVVADSIRPPTPFANHTALVCVENTHQASGGSVWPLDALRAVAKVAHEKGCVVYCDGARIFNASVAAGVPVRDYAAEGDALSFCFSKGLGAPIGSMLVGTEEFVARARSVRRMLGGGMRQTGVLAAAARVAVDTMVQRLAEDHENALRLAEGVAEILAGSVDPDQVETNIVFIDVGDREALDIVGKMWEDGVRMFPYSPHLIRCVTSYEVGREGIERAIVAFRDAAVR